MVDMNGQDGDSFQFLWGWGLRGGHCPSSPPTQNLVLSLSLFSPSGQSLPVTSPLYR